MRGVAFVECFVIEATRQAAYDFFNIPKHIMHFQGIAAAKHHRATGGGRKVTNIPFKIQFRVATGKGGVHEIVGCFFVHRQNVGNGNLGKQRSGSIHLPEVARDLAARDLTDFGNGVAGDVVHQDSLIEAGVLFAETQCRDTDHRPPWAEKS